MGSHSGFPPDWVYVPIVLVWGNLRVNQGWDPIAFSPWVADDSCFSLCHLKDCCLDTGHFSWFCQVLSSSSPPQSGNRWPGLGASFCAAFKTYRKTYFSVLSHELRSGPARHLSVCLKAPLKSKPSSWSGDGLGFPFVQAIVAVPAPTAPSRVSSSLLNRQN